MQRILKELIDNKRVYQQGAASGTRYRIENIERIYRKYDFIYVRKGNDVAGIFFKLDDSFEFYYLNEYLVNPEKSHFNKIPILNNLNFVF